MTEHAIQMLEETIPELPQLPLDLKVEVDREETLQESTPEMTTVDIDGYAYIGLIEIPVLEKKLPVMSEWDYTRLKVAPCRQFGALDSDDLVIAAHNYKKHFGSLNQLSVGDAVVFTDMVGQEVPYVIAMTTKLDATQVDVVQNSDYDLVLYTCTPGGEARVGIFCNRRAS